VSPAESIWSDYLVRILIYLRKKTPVTSVEDIIIDEIDQIIGSWNVLVFGGKRSRFVPLLRVL